MNEPDRDALHRLYVVERRSILEIAATLGVSNTTVLRWLRKHGIPRRSLSEALKGRKPSAAALAALAAANRGRPFSPEHRVRLSATAIRLGRRPPTDARNYGMGGRPTPMELRLLNALPYHEPWILRQRFPTGVPVGRGEATYFEADLFHPLLRLVVEIDGRSHTKSGARERDARKEAFFRARGFAVLRVTNNEVRRDLPSVVARIMAAAEEREALLRALAAAGLEVVGVARFIGLSDTPQEIPLDEVPGDDPDAAFALDDDEEDEAEDEEDGQDD